MSRHRRRKRSTFRRRRNLASSLYQERPGNRDGRGRRVTAARQSHTAALLAHWSAADA